MTRVSGAVACSTCVLFPVPSLSRSSCGSFLCSIPQWTTEDLGEPLNVIISARSDPGILSEHGIRTYVKSIGFDKECMGVHIGHIHIADLGDGEGKKDEQFLGRQSYFPMWGTCWESAVG